MAQKINNGLKNYNKIYYYYTMQNHYISLETIARAYELFYENATPTEEEAKLIKELEEETDRELKIIANRRYKQNMKRKKNKK
jgi:hypothetical protein